MNTVLIKLLLITSFVFVNNKFYSVINQDVSTRNHSSPLQYQKPKPKEIIIHSALSDTTFSLKIENEKRVVDNALKAKLSREIKAAIAKHHLKKPYKIAMGFTKGARDVETFLFGEQIFYTLAESGFAIKGTPVDMHEETPNPIPQIKVQNGTIYIILSKL